jgi:hypothetical protein
MNEGGAFKAILLTIGLLILPFGVGYYFKSKNDQGKSYSRFGPGKSIRSGPGQSTQQYPGGYSGRK